MKIEQDPITGLWCRSDGAVLMPPSKGQFNSIFRWTFGSLMTTGYRCVGYRGKYYRVHQLVCRAYHGLPPADKPEVDHINRVRSANFASNLRWVSRKENSDNRDCVDRAFETNGVRYCDSKATYMKVYRETHREEHNARGKAYYERHRGEINARDRARWAAKAARMKSKGLAWGKGPDGKYCWHPRTRAQAAGIGAK